MAPSDYTLKSVSATTQSSPLCSSFSFSESSTSPVAPARSYSQESLTPRLVAIVLFPPRQGENGILTHSDEEVRAVSLFGAPDGETAILDCQNVLVALTLQ